MKCPHCNGNIDVRFIKAPESQGGSSSDSLGNIGELLSQIHDDELETDFEIEFIKSLRERFDQYGPRTMMSEKQMTILRKIAAK